jgi:hypothetical protein
MRPLRLLLSLATSLTALSLLLYLVFGEQNEEEQQQRLLSDPDSAQKSRLNALFSFTSPGSLFPPSAIISLTDDNSTFFLARPAAFGPALPSTGLSSALWIGSGFGDETMSKGELGCSDVPGWDGGNEHGEIPAVDARSTEKSQDIQSLQEGAEIEGKVVLLKRGGCGFMEKVLWAQRRGAVALIVGDDVRGGGLVRMYARGDTSNVTIPSLFTSYTTAHLLSSLLPTGGVFQMPSPEEVATLNIAKAGNGRTSNSVEKAGKQTEKSAQATTTPNSPNAEQTVNARPAERSGSAQEVSWFNSILSAINLGDAASPFSHDDSRRPPSTPVDFVIGEQDWRDPALLLQPTPIDIPQKHPSATENNSKSGSARPSSGEYDERDTKESGTWLSRKLAGEKDSTSEVVEEFAGSSATLLTNARSKHDGDSSDISKPHEGLWVTLTPTNMSTSPFFDTLLVLVVSPLVTLTVVYALLLLRSRIRRRRWRAPKSLVERLPIRTYHTISDSSPSATPNASSPSTPLLQHSPPQPTSPPSRTCSRTESEVPATSSSFLQPNRTPEEEKRETGLAAWRRRYGGRQKECVVCLEEYEDGVSQVMSLPCGHEFHADCM